jgi:tetraacyldisaccharide 4'-kinase
VRKRLEPWLQAIWYGDKPPPLALRALSAVYGGVSALRSALYRNGWLHSERASIPVIVVGNLTAGGSGKTPTIIALAQALRARGEMPGILSRGYGGTYRERWRSVQPDSDPAEVGDEPVLLARATGVPVVVARKRIDGARALAAQGCSVVLADDGLQHHALQRDLEILVVHGERRFGNQRLLPAGPLREQPRAGRFPLVLVNGGTPAAGEFALHSELSTAVRLSDGQRQPLDRWAGQAVQAFAGIADPQGFFNALSAQGLKLQSHVFPDHHQYRAADFAFAQNSADDLLCTSKDAVKLQDLGALRQRIWEVPQVSRLPDALLEPIMQCLKAAR